MVALLYDEDSGGDVSCLRCLGGWQVFNFRADKEAIRKIVQFALGGVGLFIYIGTEAHIPAVFGVIGIASGNDGSA